MIPTPEELERKKKYDDTADTGAKCLVVLVLTSSLFLYTFQLAILPFIAVSAIGVMACLMSMTEQKK